MGGLRGRRGFLVGLVMRHGLGARVSVAGWKKAIQSFRLRLHSGLRQSGRLLRSWLFLARLKPCPFRFEVSVGDGREQLRDGPLMT
jgi:hypothetical protein